MKMDSKKIKSQLLKVVKIKKKLSEISIQEKELKTEGQLILNKLAKTNCPYKKGQIFKKKGQNIWASIKDIEGKTINHGPLPENYYKSPYQFACFRCTAKGIQQKYNWIFIDGEDIGKTWDTIEM
jgi:hypothetical protein